MPTDAPSPVPSPSCDTGRGSAGSLFVADLPGRDPGPTLATPPSTGYRELARTAGLSAAEYRIPVGAVDDQVPHREDEVYVVVAGRGCLELAGHSTPVRPGTVIVVPASTPHRFVDVAEELVLAVVFSPPYSGR